MVHTFQCLGVNIAVDVNSGAVHVLDELTYHLLEQVQPPMESTARRSFAPGCPSTTQPPWRRPGRSCAVWRPRGCFLRRTTTLTGRRLPPCSSRPW